MPAPEVVEAQQLNDAVGRADVEQTAAEVMQRITAAAATTLGQVATIATAEGVYGLGSHDDDDHAEADVYPWVDAVRWRPDDGWEQLDGHEAGHGDDTDKLLSRQLEAAFGSREDMGWVRAAPA